MSEGLNIGNHRIRLIRPEDNPAVAQIIRQVMTEFGAVGCGLVARKQALTTRSLSLRLVENCFWFATHHPRSDQWDRRSPEGQESIVEFTPGITLSTRGSPVIAQLPDH